MGFNMKQLTLQEINNLSSKYIVEDLKKESWSIESVKYTDTQLISLVSIQSNYQSQTDNNQFHLSTFTIGEFSAQLTVIYSNLLAGYTVKVQEMWVLEETFKFIKPIRSKNNIKITLHLKSHKKYKKNHFFHYDITVESKCGGLSKISCKVKL